MNPYQWLHRYKFTHIWYSAKALHKVQIKISRIRSKIIFLNACIKENIIPNTFRIPLRDSVTVNNIIRKAEIDCLHNAVKNNSNVLNLLCTQWVNLLAKFPCNDDTKRFLSDIHQNDITFQNQLAKKHINKLCFLHKKQKDVNRRPVNISSTTPAPTTKTKVINKSSIILTDAETDILSRGLNFAFPPRKLNPQQIFADIETSIQGLPSIIQDNIRLEAIHQIKINRYPVWSKTQRQDYFTIKNILDNKDIIITNADKGGSVVILDKSEYNTRMFSTISDQNVYNPIKRDPTKTKNDKIRKTLGKLLRSEKITPQTHNYLLNRGPQSPKLYGLPKLKNDKMRPIISTVQSPSYKIGKFLTKILSPRLLPTKFSVKNSTDFISKLNNISLKPDQIMMSCDVVSLYTSIPHKGALDALDNALSDPQILDGCIVDKETIMELADLCLQDNYFRYDNTFYSQSIGLPMGGSLSSLLANIYMDEIDQQIESAPIDCRPDMYVRYVDDIFCIIKRDKLNILKDFVNSISDNIKFTFEDELNKQIPFLDVLIERVNSGFHTSVYRKSIASDIILHFDSFHPHSQKISLIYFFTRRAVKICSSQTALDKEISFLKGNFSRHNYPPRLVNFHIKKALIKFNTPPPTSQPQKSNKFFAFPYTGPNTNNLIKLCRNANIIVGQTPGQKIAKLRAPFKEKTELFQKSNVVYEIKCNNCEKSYVGETQRHLVERITEHKRAVKVEDDRYATFIHTKETGHTMDFEKPKILGLGKSNRHRELLEAAHITSNKNSLNQCIGKCTPKHIWKTAFFNHKRIQTHNNGDNTSGTVSVREISRDSHSISQGGTPVNNQVTDGLNSTNPPEGSEATRPSSSSDDVTNEGRHVYNLRSRQKTISYKI